MPKKTAKKKAAAKRPTKKAARKAPSKGATKRAGMGETAELRVVRKDLADLLPHPRNEEIRLHPEPDTAEWTALRASLRDDYFDPLVWNRRNGMLVSGHLRRKVMLAEGVVRADVVAVDYDEPTHLARMVAANRGPGLDIESGLSALMLELGELKGFDIGLAGFTLGQLEAATGGPVDDGGDPGGPALPPEVELVIQGLIGDEVPAESGGEYRAGEHRLFCASVIDGHPAWAGALSEGVLLLVRPGPYCLLRADLPPSVVVEPDPAHLSLILSNYARVFGEGSVTAA